MIILLYGMKVFSQERSVNSALIHLIELNTEVQLFQVIPIQAIWAEFLFAAKKKKRDKILHIIVTYMIFFFFVQFLCTMEF